MDFRTSQQAERSVQTSRVSKRTLFRCLPAVILARKIIQGMFDYSKLIGDMNNILIAQYGWASVWIHFAHVIQIDSNDWKVKPQSGIDFPSYESMMRFGFFPNKHNYLISG
jgi:hypothetical protein